MVVSGSGSSSPVLVLIAVRRNLPEISSRNMAMSCKGPNHDNRDGFEVQSASPAGVEV